MAKIKNPTLFSDYFGIDIKTMNKLKIFNPLLNVDTKLFIDPLLLKNSQYEIISKKSVALYKKKFEDIILLLVNSTTENDFAWKNALKLLPKREIEGTCLGYGVNSISGRSLNEKIRYSIIQTSNEIVRLGIRDPELFMLLPLFEEGIGPDTISDITTSLIEDCLLEFTSEIAKELKIKTERVNYKGISIEIIKNPLKKVKSPVLLLPQDILRHLPVVSSWDEIADAASFNAALRYQVNGMVSSIWRAKTKREKARVKREILQNRNSLEQLLVVIKKGSVSSYDFSKDNLGLVAWQGVLTTVSQNYPLVIDDIPHNEVGLKKCVNTIIEQFQFLVEEKGLNKLFWKNKNEPNNEKIVQMVFYAVAYSYCKANNIDINPEMDTGNGNVDFKFSKGFNKRLIVEVKNSYNPNIVSGFTKQLKLYMKAEETCFGCYVIVDVGNIGKKYESLLKLYNDDKDKKADIYYINAEIKASPSKIK